MDASEDLEEPIDQNDSLEDHIRRDHETDPNLQVSIKAIFLQVRQSEDGQRELCVLLGHHRRHNKYLLPGGRIENDDFDKGFLFESVLDRELREELGLRCRDFANPYFPIQEETFPPNTVLRDYWGGEHTDLSDNYSNYPPPNGDGGLNRIDIGMIFYLHASLDLPINIPETSELDGYKWLSIYSIRRDDIFENTRVFLRSIPKILGGEG